MNCEKKERERERKREREREKEGPNSPSSRETLPHVKGTEI